MKKISPFIFIWLVIAVNLIAQPKFDSKGTDFWLIFLPNYHNNIDNTDPEMRFGDSLFIFINAERPTNGTINYTDRFGIRHSQNYAILNTNEMYIFRVSFLDYELWGYNYSGRSWGNYQTEKIAPQSFHITSDDDITVYAHSQAETTSDAFLVLPTDVLSDEYYILSYNSDGRDDLDQYSRTPSQFAVVASEDNTTVQITTKIATYLNNPGTRSIILNKGNAYLVQARFDAEKQNPDLTGSYIKSDKPVAVFSGHQRSTIPVTTLNSYASRDCLMEQLPPVNTWGKNAFVIPPKEPNDPNSITGSLYRVLACQDSTTINVNGIARSNINAGEFFEENLNSPKEVISNKPILISVYKFTAGESGVTFPLGDPFMMIIPPKEQFLRSCRVNNIQTSEKNPGDNLYYKVYYEQYITIVAQSDAIDSIYIDDIKLLGTEFTRIGTGEYSYSHYAVEDGVHYISSREPVGVYVYGYGNANSFGYIGGMDFKKINFGPPEILVIDSCFKVNGQVKSSDSSIYLTDVSADINKTNNVDISISNLQNKYIIDLTVTLINNRFDGATVIKATDSENRTSEKLIEIPGLTLSSVGPRYSDTIPHYNVTANPDAKIVLNIWNYGKYDQNIMNANLKLSGVGRVVSFPAIIPSGMLDSVLIEYSVTDDIVHYDTLLVETKCGTLIMATFTIKRSSCDISAFEFPVFVDKSNLLLNGRTFLSNQFIRLTDADRNRTGSLWYYTTVPVLDGFTTEFKFRFTTGNNYQCEDGSLQGADGIAFVVQNAGKAALGFSGGGIGYEGIYNSLAIEFDTFSNDSTQIENYHDPNGNHVAVNTNGIWENTSKHLPGTTLGLNKNILPLKADSTFYYAKIQYNLKNKSLIILLDTVENPQTEVLNINNFDIGKYLSLDRGYRAYVGFTSATGCAVETHDIFAWSFCPLHPNPETQIEDNDYGQDLTSELSIMPNPFNNSTTIRLNLQKDENIKIDIIDLIGITIQNIYQGNLQKGIHNFEWNPGAVDRGMYFVRVNGNTFQVINKLIYTY